MNMQTASIHHRFFPSRERPKGTAIQLRLPRMFDLRKRQTGSCWRCRTASPPACVRTACGRTASAVTIRAKDFKDKSHQQTLLEPTDITDEIFHASKSLFSQLWDGRTPLRLLGISLTELTRDEYAQQSLFTDEKKEKEKKLDRAVDSIRGKFGFDTISRGAILRANFQVGKKYRAQMDKDRNEDP